MSFVQQTCGDSDARIKTVDPSLNGRVLEDITGEAIENTFVFNMILVSG